MISSRILPVMAFAGMAGGLIMSLITVGEYRAEREQYDSAIIHLNDTIKQERTRYDETDRKLAETARDRRWFEQEADALAQQVAQTKADNDCINTVIPGAVAVSLFQYRDRSANQTGARTADMDRSATTAGYRPTFGQYIAASEQFFQQCNADRVSVGEWSRQEQ